MNFKNALMLVSRSACIAMLASAIPLFSACKSDQGPKASAYTVVYVPLKPEETVLRRDYPGRVVAAEMAEVRPQAGGILIKRLFEEGSEVRAGQALYRIDDAPFKAAYEEAKARLEKAESREKAARRQMERCIRLARSNAVPIRERDDAIAAYNEVEAEIKAAREQLRKAAIDLDYAEITAPVSGIIGRSLVPEGSLVAPNQQQPLAVINQLEPVYVDIPLPVSDMISLRKNPDLKGKGQALAGLAEIKLEDGSWLTDENGDRQSCKALFSETRADEATGTVVLRLSCPNSAQALLPGMHVRANVPLRRIEDALLIPKRSVARDTRNRPVVYVLNKVDSNLYKLEERPVTLQMETSDAWLVSDGLQSGELLLVEGLQKARNGATVKGREK